MVEAGYATSSDAHGTNVDIEQAGRSGVKNQITAFDFSSRAPTIQPLAEIEASQDDSVTCLANLSTRDGVILYAGIGAKEEDRLNGRNEHFQAFEMQFPKSKDEKAEGNIQFLSKTRLFTTPQSTIAKKEGYQRIVKLSPPTRTKNAPNRRIGAIASGLAGDENEIVIFSATSNKPTDQDVIGRITLYKGQEANDLDIFTQEEGRRFRVAYVTDQDVFIQNVNYDFEQKKTTDTNEHRKVYTIPPVSSGSRSKLRCIRWVSPKHLLLLSNKPNRTGVELRLLHLYEEGPGMIALRKTLPKHVKAATDMDVALLDADDKGAYQIAIAVGGK